MIMKLIPDYALFGKAIDKSSPLVYYRVMPVKKGTIIWNADKLKVLNLINEGKPDDEIKAVTGCGQNMIDIVRKAKDDGKTPSDKAETPGAVTPALTEEESQKEKGKSTQLTEDVSETSFLTLVAQIQKIPLTPDMYISYMCALKRGYDGNIARWLSLTCRDFWLGRQVNFYAEVVGIEEHEEGQVKEEVHVD